MSPDWSAATASGCDVALARGALVVAALLMAGPVVRLLLAGLSVLPGRIGRASAAAGRVVRPGIARRLVAVVVGLGVPAASVVASVPAAHARPVGLAGPVRPVPAYAPPVLLTADGALRPAHPAERSALRSGLHALSTDHSAADLAAVVVVPGDTLWDIARRHLPAGSSASDVARAWPRWYAANRVAIGPDPSMLRPGTRLRSPDHRSAGTPRGKHHRPPTTPGGTTTDRALAESLDPDRR